MPDAERAVQAKHADAVSGIEIRDDTEDLLFILCLFQLFTDHPDLFADIFIIHPFFFLDGTIMTDGGEAVNAKRFFDGGKIKVEQLFEDGKIPFGKMVDGSVIGADFLTGHAERIFIGQEKEGQIVVPQVFVESIPGGKVEKRFHLFIDPCGKLRIRAAVLVKVLKDTGELPQDAVFSRIPVEDELCNVSVHKKLSFLSFEKRTAAVSGRSCMVSSRL